jgi:hypothetical protein
MVDALIGAMIALIATAALALVVEIGEDAIQSDSDALSPYEQELVRVSMRKFDASGTAPVSISDSELQAESENLRSWMAAKRERS